MSRTWCKVTKEHLAAQQEVEAEISAERGTPITFQQGLSKMDQRLEGIKEKEEDIADLLKPQDETNYLPLRDPKYDPKKLTEKSATYLDIIRMTAKPRINIPTDTYVNDAKSFNFTLLQLFEAENVTEARDYFFAVSRRKDSPANRNSYNIAMAEFVNADEVFLAAVLLNYLKRTEFGPDVISYNAMISGCVMYSSLPGALNYLQEMNERGIAPNQQTRQYLMALHLKLGNIDQALALVEELGPGMLPEYANGLFARAYANAGDYTAMAEAAWEKGEPIESCYCSSIVEMLVTKGEVAHLDQFLQKMDHHKAKLSWSAGQSALRAFQDKRNGVALNPVVEDLVARVTSAPDAKERVDMIRTAVIQEREEEVVFRRRKRRAPIWKRKVEYKNPADAAWDTLIQEFLATAQREQKLVKSEADYLRRREDSSRKPDESYFKSPEESSKNQRKWKL